MCVWKYKMVCLNIFKCENWMQLLLFQTMFLKRFSRIRNKEKCEKTSDLVGVASFNHSESLQCVFYSRTNLAWCLSVFLQEKNNFLIGRYRDHWKCPLISANLFFWHGCGERRRCQSRCSARLRNLFSERANLFLWIIGGSTGIARWQLLGQEHIFSQKELFRERLCISSR